VNFVGRLDRLTRNFYQINELATSVPLGTPLAPEMSPEALPEVLGSDGVPLLPHAGL